MQEEKLQRLTADLLLLLVALIWGFGFVAQRAGMDHLGPFAFNGIRFLLGGLCLVPLALKASPRPAAKDSVPLYIGGTAAGLVLFAGASLQQIGIQYTTAGKAGFITGLYVILVPILGLFYRQPTNKGTWLGALLAVIGMALLSVQEKFTVAPGDLLVLAGAFFWALHVLVLSFFSPRTHVVRLAIIQFMVCGMLSLLVALPYEIITLSAIHDAALPILFGGIISVGVGYTLQVVAQKRSPPAHAAIILSLESAFAVLGGWFLLDEHLSLRAMTGCGLMLSGMLISQVWPVKNQGGQTTP